MSRLWIIVPAVLVAALIDDAPAASPDRKPPRLVAAAMVDADGDARADRVRLTYSEKVRHPADRDGRYPFTVAGYRISSIGKATGKTLSILLVEQAQPDPSAAPGVRYRGSRAGQVKDRSGNQAVPQLFTKTTPHGRAPAPADSDGDGSLDKDDCAPKEASIHPRAADVPDLAFVDSNCDGIDGTEKDAVFASPNGNNQNPGTKEKPKREVQPAVQTARAAKKPYVLVAFGSYGRVTLSSGVSVFGGYDPSTWARRDRFPNGLSLIEGGPDAVFASDVKDVVLQHLSLRGLSGPGDRSVYGLRAVAGSNLTLQRVVVGAGNGLAGGLGADGRQGAGGGAAGPGAPGSCDGFRGSGGQGGSSAVERPGGAGGTGGGILDDGFRGSQGKVGTPGGAGGAKGNPGKPGLPGETGVFGAPGAGGFGGTSSTSDAEVFWLGRKGASGTAGKPGNGGGGGGGGGKQAGAFVNDGGGNGGGGGGGAGGPSIGIFKVGTSAATVKGNSTVKAGTPGAGGAGGRSAPGGAGVNGEPGIASQVFP